MIFSVILDIEAPTDGGKPYPRVAEILARARSLEGVDEWSEGPTSGAFEDESVRTWHFRADVSLGEFEELVRLIEARMSGDEVEVLGLPSMPSLKFDGLCRFTSRHDLEDQVIAGMSVTPFPEFEVINRAKVHPGILSPEAWSLRAWRRIKAVLKRRYG